jgi:hypothetical protein
MMAQGTQQIRGTSPKITIDCMLASESTQLQADGCVLESSGDGHKLISPDRMRSGDFVKIRLWVENEEAFVDIQLAEVKKVHNHWIKVEVIYVSQTDRLRLKRCIDAPAARHIEQPALTDHLLIRA